MKMDVSKMVNFSLVVLCWMVGVVFEFAASQSVPDPLFSRGCRAQRGQFPHETYCQQYYNCWDGRATIEECPGKLLFNPVISACDYPEAVNCLARLRNPEPSVSGDGRCLKQFGIFPDPLDCTAFYECSHGRAFRQLCPYYTAFDERYSVCVHSYSVECGGRGGVYGTLAPPRFNIPDGGIAGLTSQIGLPLPVSGSGAAASGWDRRGLESSGHRSQSQPPIKGSSHGIGAGGVRRSGASTSGRNADGSLIQPESEGNQGSSGLGNDARSPSSAGSDSTRRGESGPESSKPDANGSGSLDQGAGGPGNSGRSGGGSSQGSSGVSSSGRGASGSGRIVSESGGVTRAPGGLNASGSRVGGTGSGNTSGNRRTGSGVGGSVHGGGGVIRNPSGGSASRVGSAGTRGVSRGTLGGITGIVDKEISATGQERQYERAISPEATFRCPQPRGLYPNAVDCTRFWLCREYKPSQLKCPTGQLFDLASLTCLHPEKAQCSSISPRT